MSNLRELITELCPDGVEYKKVLEILYQSREENVSSVNSFQKKESIRFIKTA